MGKQVNIQINVMEWERAGQQVSRLQLMSGSHAYPEQTFNLIVTQDTWRTFYSGRSQMKDTPGEHGGGSKLTTEPWEPGRSEKTWRLWSEHQLLEKLHKRNSTQRFSQVKFFFTKITFNHKNSHKFTFLTTQNSIFLISSRIDFWLLKSEHS